MASLLQERTDLLTQQLFKEMGWDQTEQKNGVTLSDLDQLSLSIIEILSGADNSRGPKLHDLIEAEDRRIQALPEDEKLAAVEERNEFLKTVLTDGLIDLYGEEAGQQLARNLIDQIEAIEITERIPSSQTEKEVCLVIYPNTFGNLEQLSEMLPVYKEMGVTKIHILPFYEQGGDEGFAVKYQSIEEPLKIDQRWGEENFKKLVDQASQLGIKIMADAVLNHMAIDSPILDDLELKEKLLMAWPAEEVPFECKGVRTDHESGGQYAVYCLPTGEEREALIIFPEQADPTNPHLETDGEMAYYHTFYPFQADLDLRDPLAFELIGKTILQLTEKLNRQGQIRLDAIPFIGKNIDQDCFEHIDCDAGFKLISMLRVIAALAGPDMEFIAEASRPINEIGEYTERVGSAYDFISLPYYLQSVLKENPGLFLEKVKQMTKVLEFDGMEKLVAILQTHDDYPLAEIKDAAIIKDVWQTLKEKGALPFGQEEGTEGPPKGAVIRLAEMCDNNPNKIAAAVALSSFTPHGDLLMLYGTELGLGSSRNNLEHDRQLAEIEGRNVDRRAAIRQPISPEIYSQPNLTREKLSQIFKARNQYLPDQITSWDYQQEQDVTVISLLGEKDGQNYQLELVINFSSRASAFEPKSGQLVLTSGDWTNNQLEAYGYRLYLS